MRRTTIALAILGALLTRPLALDARQITWSLSGLAGQNIAAIVIDPLTPATVYAAALGAGVFKSTDGGGEWTPINNGLTTTQIRAMAIDPLRPSTLYAGSGGAGLFRTVDGGANWTLLDNARMNSNIIFDIAVDPQAPSTIYVGGNGESLLKSVDGGLTWSSSGPISSQAIAIDPQNPATIYAGTDIAVYISVDAGASWAVTPVQPFSIFDIAIDPQTSSTVYVSVRPYRNTDTGGVLRSTDGGVSWTPVTTGLAEMARAVTIDPASTSTLYAALLPSGSETASAFRSTHAGGGWSAINEGLESVDVRSFAIDAVVTHLVYAATTGGVFVTSSDLPRSTLTVTKRGPGAGRITSSPSGVDCQSSCSESFLQGTVVTLAATPGARSRFAGWVGCDSTSGTSCVVTIGADRSVWAAFVGAPFGYSGGGR